MIRSMTGYGEAALENDQLRLAFRLKAVNHKGLDCQIRIFQEYAYLEPLLRKWVSETVHRGRVDVHCEITTFDPALLPKASLNRAKVQQLQEISKSLKDEFGIAGELEINDLVRMDDLLLNQKVGFQFPQEIETQIERVFKQALEKFQESRVSEGLALKVAFEEHHRVLQENLKKVVQVDASRPELFRDTFTKKVEQSLEEYGLDQARLHQEIAFHLERLDITEEITRLTAHLIALTELLNREMGPHGKQMEFVVQEIHREITTIGNKARHGELAQCVIQLKTHLEKIREQLLNIE